MSQIACVNIPSFALQLLSHKEPLWRDYPLAVVTEEKPTGIILELNRMAKNLGVKTGMRYSSALTLAPNLHVSAVSEQEVLEGLDSLLGILTDLSPEIEPFDLCPGIFWINASGFQRLFGTEERWAESLGTLLQNHGYISRIAIGYSRFGTFLAAKRAKEPIVFRSEDEELSYARYTPLTLLPMPPKASQQLKNLGIDTIGAFIDLPPGGVRKRFPKDVSHWYTFVSSAKTHPIQPKRLREDLVLTQFFQPELKTLQPVLLHFRELLDHLLTDVMKHNEFVRTLSCWIVLEDGTTHTELVSPSKPTVRSDTLYRLLTLRLAGLKISSCVSKIEISAQRVEQRSAQELLFQENQTRDTKEGEKAFALIRAELGNNTVQYPEIVNEHLPERQIRWSNTPPTSPNRENHPQPDTQTPLKLVRRMYRTCGEVPSINRRRMRIHSGPVRFATDWWEDEVKRDYHYIEDDRGAIHWAYRDTDRDTWVFQGFVS